MAPAAMLGPGGSTATSLSQQLRHGSGLRARGVPAEASRKRPSKPKGVYKKPVKPSEQRGGSSLVAFAVVLGTEILITWWAWERLKRTAQPGAPVADLFPGAWGLWLGIRGVLIGHVVILLYHTLYKWIGGLGYGRESIQKVEPTFSLLEELREHLSRPEAFTMLVPYLSITWMFRLMPNGYYDLDQSVSWFNVFLQLAVVDLITYAVHRAQHRNPFGLYTTHKDHHVFVNPHIFNAYSGSWKDTSLLIIIPLYATVVVLDVAGVYIAHADYMWFGAVYANYFMLIHSEFPQPWDRLFLLLGIGTSEDHNVHHSAVHYNFGHFFMWWDRLFGTYKHPHAWRRNRRYAPAEMVGTDKH